MKECSNPALKFDSFPIFICFYHFNLFLLLFTVTVRNGNIRINQIYDIFLTAYTLLFIYFLFFFFIITTIRIRFFSFFFSSLFIVTIFFFHFIWKVFIFNYFYPFCTKHFLMFFLFNIIDNQIQQILYFLIKERNNEKNQQQQ